MKTAVKLPWYDPNTEVMGIYHHANGRRYVRLINIHNRDDWTAILFAKYLLSYFLGRRLSRDEILDHHDRNPRNDSIFNLRVVTEAQSHLEDSRRIKDIIVNCIWCNKEIKIRNRSSAWEKPGPFCRSCSGKYSRGLQLGTQDKLPPRERIEPKFYYIEKAPNTTIPIDQIDRAKELDLILPDVERRQRELAISELDIKTKRDSALELKAQIIKATLPIKVVKEIDYRTAPELGPNDPLPSKINNEDIRYLHFDPECYGVTIHSENGRRFIYIRNIKTKKKKNTAYARYLLEQKLGRYLDKDEWADHKNRNHSDDRLDNLQVITSKESGSLDAKRVKDIEITCVFCQKKIIKPYTRVKSNIRAGATHPFCSTSHGIKFGNLPSSDPRKQIPDYILPEPEFYFLNKEKFLKEGIEEAEEEFIDYYSKKI